MYIGFLCKLIRMTVGSCMSSNFRYFIYLSLPIPRPIPLPPPLPLSLHPSPSPLFCISLSLYPPSLYISLSISIPCLSLSLSLSLSLESLLSIYLKSIPQLPRLPRFYPVLALSILFICPSLSFETFYMCLAPPVLDLSCIRTLDLRLHRFCSHSVDLAIDLVYTYFRSIHICGIVAEIGCCCNAAAQPKKDWWYVAGRHRTTTMREDEGSTSDVRRNARRGLARRIQPEDRNGKNHAKKS